MRGLALIAAAVLAACVARQPIVLEGEPIAVPAGLTVKQVEHEIRGAIKDKNASLRGGAFGWSMSGAQTFWAIEDSAPGEIVAALRVRLHYLRLEIRYTAREVVTEIIDSQNLDQTEYSIHPRALAWQRELERIIESRLRVAAGMPQP